MLPFMVDCLFLPIVDVEMPFFKCHSYALLHIVLGACMPPKYVALGEVLSGGAAASASNSIYVM